LYGIITTLEDPSGLNRTLIKFGYSENIFARMQKLGYEYKTELYLVRLKLIRGESTEKEFHRLMKNLYPLYSIDISVDGHTKEEIYVLDEKIITEYDNFEDDTVNKDGYVIKRVETRKDEYILRENCDLIE